MIHSALTVEDERRQISQLINVFIHKVYFGRDLEQQLSFYVEARGTFSNLDAVYVTLVHAACKLATRNRSKSTGFVKACIAYCFITIPSIGAVQQQMDLYLLCCQLALQHLCLGQGKYEKDLFRKSNINIYFFHQPMPALRLH